MRALAAATALWLVATGGAAVAQNPVSAKDAAHESAAVAKIVALARGGGLKVLVCAEFDDAAGEARIDIVGQLPGSATVISYNGPKKNEIFEAIGTEQRAAGKNGWRRLVVVVDGDAVDVRRQPQQGPIATAGARVHADVHRVFPGHTPTPF